MIDHMDAQLAAGAFDDERDEMSYQRWLDDIAADAIYTQREMEKLMERVGI